MLPKTDTNTNMAFELLEVCNEVYNFHERMLTKICDLRFRMYGTMFSTPLPMELMDAMLSNIKLASQNADIATQVYERLFNINEMIKLAAIYSTVINNDDPLDEPLEINTYKL